jgi:hypothetical protein
MACLAVKFVSLFVSPFILTLIALFLLRISIDKLGVNRYEDISSTTSHRSYWILGPTTSVAPAVQSGLLFRGSRAERGLYVKLMLLFKGEHAHLFAVNLSVRGSHPEICGNLVGGSVALVRE